MAVNKLDPKTIFASEAPAQDTPAVFNNRTLGWAESRKSGGRPTIKQMNALQQDTELKILWLNENAVTPFDATIDYPVNAVTIKDGQFKIFNGTSWNLFLDKSSVGLSNVDNTSDLDKPISTATQDALDLKLDANKVGVANGVATLDSNGQVASAAKLTTARTIGGVSFDGTTDINLTGVNIAGNQDTSGNAATATKLETPRTISLTGAVTGSVSFDGSDNASITTTVENTVVIAKGGTGAATAQAARTNLSIYSKSEVDTKTAQATTSDRGTVTLATDAETLAGTDATKSITPASFLASLRKLVNLAGMIPHTVTTQRAFNTTYYNTRDVPMRIHVGFRMPVGANANIEVGGRAQGFVTKLSAGAEEYYTLIGFVNPQQAYRFNIVGGTPFIQMCEEFYVE